MNENEWQLNGAEKWSENNWQPHKSRSKKSATKYLLPATWWKCQQIRGVIQKFTINNDERLVLIAFIYEILHSNFICYYL